MTSPVIVVSEPGRTPLHVLLVQPLEVGRDAAGILLNDPAVSRRHVELRPDGVEAVVVADLGSANGTTLDGVAIEGEARLVPGAVVRLGDTTIELLRPSPDAVATMPESDPAPDPGRTTISRLAADIAATPLPPPQTVHDGTVTIVFTDIESSTELAFSYGDERWFTVLRNHTEIVREQVGRHGGSEIKSQGDGFMLVFGSAHRALACMIDVQRAVTALAEDVPELAVTIRVGAHTGEAIVGDDGDLFGHHVNLAARIADQASGGEILVSSLVKEIVESRGDLRFGEPRTATLKGLTGTYQLHPVLWRNDD